MKVKQDPSLRLWPDKDIVGMRITEIIPVRSENLPRRPYALLSFDLTVNYPLFSLGLPRQLV
jgi:hypothetical protein